MLMAMKLGLPVAYRYESGGDDQDDRHTVLVWSYLHI